HVLEGNDAPDRTCHPPQHVLKLQRLGGDTGDLGENGGQGYGSARRDFWIQVELSIQGRWRTAPSIHTPARGQFRKPAGSRGFRPWSRNTSITLHLSAHTQNAPPRLFGLSGLKCRARKQVWRSCPSPPRWHESWSGDRAQAPIPIPGGIHAAHSRDHVLQAGQGEADGREVPRHFQVPEPVRPPALSSAPPPHLP